MNLMIAATALRLTPVATHDNVAVDILAYATGECPLGQVLVARSIKGVCAILLGADHDGLEANLAARFPQATLVANESVVHDDLAKVIRFVDRPAGGLHLTLDMRGTPLQRRVWEKLRAIRVGRTVTYLELAVGLATRPLPVWWLAPAPPIRSHWRFLRWGIERKRELIRKESMA
jgi:AraC family transcriptional regulator, regulatory protein of adaptative response / methylated-DNA-[protein]-cysteine methyltransferase